MTSLSTDRRELIVYATPTGPLAEECARYFAEADRLGGTVAQTYPPHCTLTGFFHRHSEQIADHVVHVQSAIDELGALPADSVEVVALHSTDEWIGLELQAPQLIEWTASLAARLPVRPTEDPLRLKDWLHLSLAYGVDDLVPYRTLAQLFDPSRPARWELGLWERRGMRWERLTA